MANQTMDSIPGRRDEVAPTLPINVNKPSDDLDPGFREALEDIFEKANERVEPQAGLSPSQQAEGQQSVDQQPAGPTIQDMIEEGLGRALDTLDGGGNGGANPESVDAGSPAHEATHVAQQPQPTDAGTDPMQGFEEIQRAVEMARDPFGTAERAVTDGTVGEAVQDTFDTVSDATSESFDTASDVASDVMETAGDAFGTIADATGEVFDTASDVASDVLDGASDLVEDAAMLFE